MREKTLIFRRINHEDYRVFFDDLKSNGTSEKLEINRKSIHDWYLFIRITIRGYEKQESKNLSFALLKWMNPISDQQESNKSDENE